MIFPEMVRIFLMGGIFDVFSFLTERWPKCADLWTFGKDWWGFLSFRQHFKRLILRLYELDHCANRDLRCLPYVWSICIRMDTPLLSLFR